MTGKSLLEQHNKHRKYGEDLESKRRNTTFIPADKSSLLDWINSERTTFWCWLFIRHASCSCLGIQIADLDDKDVPYRFFEVNSDPAIHEERLVAVKKYFEVMEKKQGLTEAFKIMREMQNEWFFIEDKIKDMSWLPRNEHTTQWAWKYIRALPEFKNKGLSSWFQPRSMSERHMAIIAVFDEPFIVEYIHQKEAIKYKNYLISNFKAAYNKIKSTAKDKLKTQISVKISRHAKARLDKMVSERGATQQSIIEQLILHGSID